MATVKAYISSSFLRLKSTGMLESEPLLMLGSLGRFFARISATTRAAIPINSIDIRQPNKLPTTRPIGMPNNMAETVPTLSRLSARLPSPGGASRIANAAVIDQNTAWDKAISTRLASKTGKLQAINAIRWPPINKINNHINKERRSRLRVSSIKGSDISATTQA